MLLMSSSSLYTTLIAVAASISFWNYHVADAFFLPGTRPQSFSAGEFVKLKVNKVTSIRAQMPIEYYKLGFCQPKEGKIADHENLGEFLAGDRIENSPYSLFMKVDTYCQQTCVTNLGRKWREGKRATPIVRAIRKQYHNNWIVDNLNAASISEDDRYVTTKFWQGFPIGYVDNKTDSVYINNHVNIKLMYHQVEGPDVNKFRIVQFLVEPFSIQHEFGAEKEADGNLTIKNPIHSCGKTPSNHTSYDMVKSKPQEAGGTVLFTYDVIWVENTNLTWASRWDVYLSMDHSIKGKVHWLSIANSLVIVFVLSAMIVAILVRNLHRDINRYNKVALDEEARAEELEEYGWKLVHADVFRPPTFSPLLLSVLCGSGAQLLCMTFLTIFFAAFGFMNPSRRGRLLVGELVFFVLMGGINGYVTARLYKSFKGKAWQRATTTTAFALPGLAFSLFFLMNFIALVNGSNDAVPFLMILILLFMWFGISTPLVYLGAYLGYKQEAISFSTTTSSIPRQIPDQPWFMGIPFTLAIGGILPFGACFVELYFIMSSVWMEWYYYVFGFLFLVFIILLITCAEITVLFTYFQLCSEDYHWWWRSFCNAGSAAIYVFLYSFVYFKQLQANTAATYILYFGYMGLCSIALFCMTGFVGLASSLWFTRTIFGSIKID